MRSNARSRVWWRSNQIVFWKVASSWWNVPIAHAHPGTTWWSPAVQVSQQTQNDYSQFRTTVGQGESGLERAWRREKQCLAPCVIYQIKITVSQITCHTAKRF